MGDNVKFRKIDQMNAIKASPITYYPIATSAWSAYERMTLELLYSDVNSVIESNTANFYQLSNDESTIRFRGERCGMSKTLDAIEVSGKVELFEYDKKSGEIAKSFHGEKLTVQLSTETETRPSTKLLLMMPNAVWLDKGMEFIKPRYSAKNLALPESVTAKLGDDIIDTAEKHSYITAPSPRLTALIKDMNRKIRVTLMEIKAEIHSRLVFGIGCITLIVIGIELGIKFRGGHLLTAFGVSAIPAAALLVIIMTGKNITRNHAVHVGADLGVSFMWAGLLVLTIFAVSLYRKMLKN
jgi:hypothetical protein